MSRIHLGDEIIECAEQMVKGRHMRELHLWIATYADEVKRLTAAPPPVVTDTAD